MQTQSTIHCAGIRTLESRLDAPLTPECFLPLAVGIAASLADLHGGNAVHIDIMPSNIMLLDAGAGIIAWPGLARRRPDGPNLDQRALPYRSPEQIGRSNRTPDQRSDLYSVGVVFYRILTGRLPFDAQDPLQGV